MNLPDTIKALEALLPSDISEIESALSHLRSREQTIRQCAEICKARAKLSHMEFLACITLPSQSQRSADFWQGSEATATGLRAAILKLMETKP